jgi:hypothetical protein
MNGRSVANPKVTTGATAAVMLHIGEAVIYGVNWNPLTGASVYLYDVAATDDVADTNLIYAAGSVAVASILPNIYVKNGIAMKTLVEGGELVVYSDSKFKTS